MHYAGRGDPRSEVVRSDRLRAGDLIVVSAEYGGCDEWGWDPKSTEPVTDVAEAGARPFGARRFAVRVTPELIRQEVLRESREPGARPPADLDAIATTLSAALAAHDGEKAITPLKVLDRMLPQRLRRNLEAQRAHGWNVSAMYMAMRTNNRAASSSSRRSV